MIFSLENKFVQSPRSFFDDNIDDNIKDLFHCEFFSNGTFGLKYKTRISGTAFELSNLKTFKTNPAKSTSKTDIRITARETLDPNVDLSAAYHIEKPNRLILNFSVKKIFNAFTLSSYLVSEKGIIKDFILTPTIEDVDRQIKIQFSKSFVDARKNDKTYLFLFKNRSSFKNFQAYKNGFEIVNEEKIKDFKEYAGTNLIKFNLNSPNYFGLIASHRFTLKALRPRIENMTAFYKSPETLLTLGFTEHHKHVKSYHAALIKYPNHNLEFGVKFDTDDHHHDHLQFGVSYMEGKSHFKYKINNGLRNFLYYSYRINDRVRISGCYNFELRTSEIHAHPDDHVLLPFGLKLEINN